MNSNLSLLSEPVGMLKVGLVEILFELCKKLCEFFLYI